MPTCRIHVDKGGLDLVIVVLETHVEASIVQRLMPKLVEVSLGPIMAEITVRSLIGLLTPWIAHLYKPLLVRLKSDHTEHCVGMASRKAESSTTFITPITRSSSLNDVISAVVRHQSFPKLLHSNVFLSIHPATSMEVNGVG